MTLHLTGELPKDYEPRRMWLYVAKTRSKWGFWLSDGNGYSVRALIANGNPGGTCAMAEWFSTKHAATKWAESHRWYVWPGVGRKGVPNADNASCREYQGVTNLIVQPRGFTTTPSAIAAEHASEVSGIEAQAFAAVRP